MTHRSNLVHSSFLYSLWDRMVFTCLNDWEKLKRIILCNMWNIYKIHISVSMNKILLERIHLCVFSGCFHATMHIQLSSCDKDHMPHKLKILSSPLQKMFADPYYNWLILFTFLGPGKKKKNYTFSDFPVTHVLFGFYEQVCCLPSSDLSPFPRTIQQPRGVSPTSNLQQKRSW